MNNPNTTLKNLNRQLTLKCKLTLLTAAVLLVLPFFFVSDRAAAQKLILPPTLRTSPFKVGEKLTYSISFEKFNNAGYAELYVVSRGRLSGKDAVELHGKIKTNELVSAAFYLLDESRQTFAAAENGHPLYVRKTQNSGVLPEDTITNYLSAPTENYDILSLIYSLRYFGAEGIYPLAENGRLYTINFQTTGSEAVRTDAGEFETTLATVTSDYLTEKNITNLRINFSKDEQKVPVMIRFKTAKGEFKASLASVQTLATETAADLPPPTPFPTPQPTAAPKPVATPTPYIDNQPLSADFPFVLGESLEYQISTNSRIVGNIVLQAAERKQSAGVDGLALTAVVTAAAPGNQLFKPGDSVRTTVNPDFLTPQRSEIKFTGTLASLNQTTTFDQKNGAVSVNNSGRIEMPVGTHSLLSLIYAIRAFNLKPSKDPTNPVNDTRVAVFWENQPYIFTLRPSSADLINVKGEKVSAQLISINSGNPTLDALNLRLWLGNDENRLPLRLTLGNYQIDLVEAGNLKVK